MSRVVSCRVWLQLRTVLSVGRWVKLTVAWGFLS